MKGFIFMFPLILAASACSYGVLAADASHLQPTGKPGQIPVGGAAQDKVTTAQLRMQYQSAREVYEKLLKSVPAAEAARVAADQASKKFRETAVRENAHAQNELADLRNKMDEYVKAYLSTNADYARLQAHFDEAQNSSSAWTNWVRLRQLQEKREKLQTQTARSPAQEAELQNTRAELAPLQEYCRVMHEEYTELSGKLSNIRSQAMLAPEHKELAHRYGVRQRQMWDNSFKNDKLQAARQAMLDTKKHYEEQLAKHPELQQAKQRRDEAFRAFSERAPFEAIGLSPTQ